MTQRHTVFISAGSVIIFKNSFQDYFWYIEILQGISVSPVCVIIHDYIRLYYKYIEAIQGFDVEYGFNLKLQKY